jgi:hypothetical protein
MRRFHEINYENSKGSPLREKLNNNFFSKGNIFQDLNNQSHKIDVFKSEKSVRFI